MLVADVTVIIIMRELRQGPRRFGEFVGLGVNPRTLSSRLRKLTSEGVLTRTRYAESPPRVEYELTEKGRALLPVLAALEVFGETWLPPADLCPEESTPRQPNGAQSNNG